MAFTLQLTDGTDTIDFIDVAFQVEDGGLQISPPEQVQTWTDPSAIGTGARLVESRYGNRKIHIVFHIAGVDRATIRTNINRVNTILHKAIQHSLGNSSERVSLLYGWDGVSEIDNFEVFSGELTLPDDVLSVEKIHATWGSSYRLRGCELDLVVSPQSYGLSPSTGSLIELPLTNRNGTDLTGGVYIRPFTDTRNIQTNSLYIDNYVDIAGADISGDSPAVLKIELMSVTGSQDADRIIIGAHQKHAGQMFFHWTDANVEMLLAGGSTVTSSYVLGGSVWRSGTIEATSRAKVWRVRLQNPDLYGSKKYRVFMTTGFYPYQYVTQLPMQLNVETGSGAILAQGPIVEQYYSASGRAMIQDLGVVQLPPQSPKIPDPQDIYLSLNLVGDAPFAHALTLGHVWLVPVEQGYRTLNLDDALGDYIASYPTVVEDYWNDISYISDSLGANTIAAVQAMYEPITLEPGVDQRIYFNFEGHDYVPNNLDTWSVRVYYSPVYSGAL